MQTDPTNYEKSLTSSHEIVIDRMTFGKRNTTLDIYVNASVTQEILTRYASEDFDLPIEDIEIIFEQGQYWCQFVNDDSELERYSVVKSNQGIEFEEI